MAPVPLEEAFQGTIKERSLLSHKESPKETYHIVIDLEGSGIEYSVGDCLGIYPQNNISHIERIISSLGANPNQIVINKKNNATCTLYDYLLRYANLSKVTSSLLKEVVHYAASSEQQIEYNKLFDPSRSKELKQFLDSLTIVDLALLFPLKNLEVQTFCNYLLPLLPRFYSIASSQSKVGNEAHLTVGMTRYINEKGERSGVCSDYLCYQGILRSTKISLFHHPADHFRLSEESFIKPLIMIGPGTGIAPFRGFMQERLHRRSSHNWLFFGEWHRTHHFYYESYWIDLANKGLLDLSLAFSRDQMEKIYVQNKLHEESSKLYAWIKEGAYIYVCGDAKKMAREVDLTLQSIIQKEGNYNEKEAKEFLKLLKEQKRYCRDVY